MLSTISAPTSTATSPTGWLREHTLTCPCHDARFDVRTGKNLDWIAPGPVATFPVRIDGNDVLIGL